ncbi:MAG TPA: hypothetical protein DDY37_02355 [Legionella sp.]|nr:hypothetical protein [Legionella sp.]
MLLQIRDFIRQSEVASTQQMAREFHVDEEALQPMLDIWVRKGMIEKCHEKAACASACMRCKTHVPVFYQVRR